MTQVNPTTGMKELSIDGVNKLFDHHFNMDNLIQEGSHCIMEEPETIRELPHDVIGSVFIPKLRDMRSAVQLENIVGGGVKGSVNALVLDTFFSGKQTELNEFVKDLLTHTKDLDVERRILEEGFIVTEVPTNRCYLTQTQWIDVKDVITDKDSWSTWPKFLRK